MAAILTRCKTSLIDDWLVRTKKTPELNHLHLSDDERTGHLPKLVDDLVVRLDTPKLPDKDSDAIASPAAVEHGKLRRTQGYSSAMLIHESRILQVTIFGTLHKNLSMLDFNLLLPMRIADSGSVRVQRVRSILLAMTNDERMQRESSLIVTIKKNLPDFAKACAYDTELVLLHQDAFAADYQEDEYTLLGWRSSTLDFVGKKCA